jgi:polyribonucleotide nucleotidyltransferase
VVLAVAAQAIGAVLAAVADSTAVALAEAGKSSQITKSPFFPMDCFVPLQIP